MTSILHDGLYKRNDKKTYQFSKHHTNGLEDLIKFVSRKITKFITKMFLISKESLDVDSNRFIENVKYYIERCGIENGYNLDQSGFQLELHVDRTLER